MDSQSTNTETEPTIKVSENDSEPQVKKDTHWVTVLSMALFVLLSLSIVGFLYYQNQQLKKMLADYQPQAIPSPTASVNPTANWKIYPSETIVGLKYSFRYPNEAKLVEAQDRAIFTIRESELTHIYNGKNNDIENIMDNYQPLGSTKINFSNIQPVTIGNLEGYKATANNQNEEYIYYFLSEEKVPGILIFSYLSKEVELEKLLTQILSTLKFTEDKQTPEPKACTLEAKMCSDGSYVGRTGPNCEFAPCPTPKS